MLKSATIGCNILIIEKYFKSFLKGSLKNYELNTAEGMVLLALYGHNGQKDAQILKDSDINLVGTSQDQLIDELHYDKSVITRTMQSLEKKGYVIRKNNTEDTRSYFFKLTDKAFTFKQTLIEILKEWNEHILGDFDESVLNLLDNMLAKVAKNATKTIRKNN
ncbi:MarR family winged helix-turn-helix transcriptional regulator [Clostridium psychrophilum]|uniref:MarR family winged helix-turn-helix transcriptional regulator n=1 Tax=Clostridium psychrophilum TaxID=132926 RepID=UPI001C0B0577|nr:MarR family transcriptional regulator [Clostridium psychrophilum]MBU3182138.1 MarR family transcriptional regulator [Clostridium psychrophilum]